MRLQGHLSQQPVLRHYDEHHDEHFDFDEHNLDVDEHFYYDSHNLNVDEHNLDLDNAWVHTVGWQIHLHRRHSVLQRQLR
jgi:hypothetical protein